MLKKPVVLNRWLLAALLLVIIAIPSVVFWSVQRMDMHRRWQTQFVEAQTFAFYHMWTASSLLLSGPWPGQTTVDWARTEVQSARNSLVKLSYLDRDHANQLLRIDYVLVRLTTNWSDYVLNLTYTERTTLSNHIRTIGDKLLNAYGNYINYTSTNTTTGPSFWYIGPSPPDEDLLRQVVDLANTLPGLPSLPS